MALYLLNYLSPQQKVLLNICCMQKKSVLNIACMQKSFWHKFAKTVFLKSLSPEPSEKTELMSQNKTKK